MENKITLAVLARMLSDRTGRGRKECEDLLRSFFQNISASLTAGEAVKVRGFGTFKISQVDARMSVDVSSGQEYEIPAHSRIVFLPAKELAAAVNAPFGMFETIELADTLTEEELRGADDPEELHGASGSYALADDEPAPPEDEPEAPYGASAPAEDDEIRSDATPEAEEEKLTVIHEEPAAAERAEPEEVLEEAADDLEDVDEEVAEVEPVAEADSRHLRRKFRHGFIWGAVAAVVAIAVGFTAGYMFDAGFHKRVDAVFVRQTLVADTIAAPANTVAVNRRPAAAAHAQTSSDSVADRPAVSADVSADAQANDAVPTRPSDQPVYDTVSPTVGLGAMARKHYGNYHLWPYIYKENSRILGHPDRIKAGTKVVIPPLSKYGVSASNPQDIEKAKQMGAEIYARYKKKAK